jgi:polysaccharide export outer membrane protein
VLFCLGWTGLALLAACHHSQPAVVVRPVPAAVVSHRGEGLDPAVVAEVVGEDDPEPYRLGPGDTLLVAVYGHPELSIAPFVPMAVGAQGGRPAGLLVDNDGTVELPLIGPVQAAGKSSDELRALLEDKLAVYIKDPSVAVQVLFAGNIRYYLLGQFTNPGLKYSDRPLRLLEALSLGGSLDLERASLRSAYVARLSKRLPVDLRRLVLDGDLTQNIRLKTGDVVVVPDRQNEQAFVFGGAPGSNPAGGAVPFINGRLDLLQALARAGFGMAEHFHGDLADTHVIRSEGDRGELFIVNAEAILEGEAAPFELAPGDVVYVPATPLADWDQALSALLPFLQGVAGVLTPFVQIKYLSQH